MARGTIIMYHTWSEIIKENLSFPCQLISLSHPLSFELETNNSFQFSEASEHGFADCVFVRVWSRESVVGAFSAKSSSLCSQLCLKRKKEILEIYIQLLGLMSAEWNHQISPGHFCGYLNWCSDALLVATKTFTLLPAHGLQHLVPDIVTVETIFSGLFVVTAKGGKKRNILSIFILINTPKSNN